MAKDINSYINPFNPLKKILPGKELATIEDTPHAKRFTSKDRDSI